MRPENIVLEVLFQKIYYRNPVLRNNISKFLEAYSKKILNTLLEWSSWKFGGGEEILVMLEE